MRPIIDGKPTNLIDMMCMTPRQLDQFRNIPQTAECPCPGCDSGFHTVPIDPDTLPPFMLLLLSLADIEQMVELAPCHACHASGRVPYISAN